MKKLWWLTTDNDTRIIDEMHKYVVEQKQKNNLCLFCGSRRRKINIQAYKQSRGGTAQLQVVAVESNTDINEWLHYYALCTIATSHGAQLLISV